MGDPSRDRTTHVADTDEADLRDAAAKMDAYLEALKAAGLES